MSLNPKTAPTVPPSRPLGRDTNATMAAWDALVATMPRAPYVMRGAPPPRSPNVSRFDPAIPWYQTRGFCVGRTLAMLGIIINKIPANAGPASAPLPTVVLNSNFAYDISRMECAAEGINLGMDDGSIVSCALKAAAKDGFVRWAEYDTDEDHHINNTIPDEGTLALGRQHIGQFALCDSFEHGLELNAAGFPLDLGSSIPEGFMTTDAHGFFSWDGAIVGGHSYRLMDHDRIQDLAVIGNNWPNWGTRSDDSKYIPCGGYTNLAFCKLSEMARWFDDRSMSTGQSEIGAINRVAGWAPLIFHSW